MLWFAILMAIFLEVLDYYSNCEKGWEKKSGSQYTSCLIVSWICLHLALKGCCTLPCCWLKAAILVWLLMRPPGDEGCFRVLVVFLLIQSVILDTSWIWEGGAGKGQRGSLDNCDISFTVLSETLTICVKSDILVMALKPHSSWCDKSKRQ